MTRSPDDALLRSAAAGDPAAMDALWRAHRRWVAAVMLAHHVEPHDLDDLLQEVVVTVIQNLQSLEDPAAFRPWLRAIALNAARSAARRSAVRRRVEHPVLDAIEAPDSEHVDRHVEGRDQVDATMRHIAQLPPELREPLLMRAVRGLSQRAIAEALDLPETTVETRLARARRWLRQAMPPQAVSARSAPMSNGWNRRTLS